MDRSRAGAGAELGTRRSAPSPPLAPCGHFVWCVLRWSVVFNCRSVPMPTYDLHVRLSAWGSSLLGFRHCSGVGWGISLGPVVFRRLIGSSWRRVDRRFFGLLNGEMGVCCSGRVSVSKAEHCWTSSRSGISKLASLSNSEFFGADGASVSDRPDGLDSSDCSELSAWEIVPDGSL